MKTDNYEPFGQEWKKEMNKFPKEILIEQLKTANIRRQETEEKLKTITNQYNNLIGLTENID